MSYLDDLRKKREEEQKRLRENRQKVNEQAQQINNTVAKANNEQPQSLQTTSYIDQLRNRRENVKTEIQTPTAPTVTSTPTPIQTEQKKSGLFSRVGNFFKENPTPFSLFKKKEKPTLKFEVGEGLNKATPELSQSIFEQQGFKAASGLETLKKDIADYTVRKPVFSSKTLPGADISFYNFTNSFLPTKLAIVALDKVGVRSPNQVRYEVGSKDHPLLAATGLFAGELTNLWLLGKAGVGMQGEAVMNKALGGTKYLLPNYLQRALPKAAGLGTLFASSTFLTETLDQIQAGHIEAGKILGETAKGFGLGFTVGGVTGGVATAPRVAGAVGGTAAYETTVKLLEDGKIDEQDFYDIAVSSAVMGVFEALAGKYPVYRRVYQRSAEFSRELTVNKIMTNGKNRKEAEMITDTLSQLEAMQFGIRGGMADTRIVEVLDKVPKSFAIANKETKTKYISEMMKQLDKGVSVNEAMEIANEMYGFNFSVNLKTDEIEQEIIKQADTAQQEKTDYEIKNRTPEIVMSRPEGAPKDSSLPLMIHSVEYDDGSFSMDAYANIGGEELVIPFSNENFTTKKEAIDAGVAAVEEFVNKQVEAGVPDIAERVASIQATIAQYKKTGKPVIPQPIASSAIEVKQKIEKPIVVEKITLTSPEAVEKHIKPKLKAAVGGIRKVNSLAEWDAFTPGNQKVVDIWKNKIKKGEVIPPIVTQGNQVVDGHHRLMAYRQLKIKEISTVPVDYGKKYPTLHNKVSEDELREQADIIADAKIGDGQFLAGEVYQQLVGGNRYRPVILTQINNDGSVEGFYLGSGFETEKDFGISADTILSAKWDNPEKELETPNFTQERLNEFIEKVFKIQKPVDVKIGNETRTLQPGTKQYDDYMRAEKRREELQLTGGSGQASRGLYINDVETEIGHLQKVYPIEVPELVDLTRDLMGQVPQVSKSAGGTALGRFYGSKLGSKMKLRADLFSTPEQVAKVLAHEIGHLIDFLPDKVRRKGNILSHVAVINGFLRGTFSNVESEAEIDKLIEERSDYQQRRRNLKDADGKVSNKQMNSSLLADIKLINKRINKLQENSISNKEIRKELLAVTKYWHPWDESKAPSSYNQYRHQANELYADALSVLLNSPGTLERMAPTFYNSFFRYLDKKPKVKEAYFDLQALMSGDREALVSRRRDGVRRMFDVGDQLAKDVQEQRVKDRAERSTNIWKRIKFDHVSRNYVFIDRINKLKKKGTEVPQDANPVYYLEERSYLSGKIKAFVESKIQPVYEGLLAEDISWIDFSEVVFYERIASGDRSEQANPRGITVDAAKELLADVQAKMGEQKWDVLQNKLTDFREAIKSVVVEAYNGGDKDSWGLYSQEAYENMIKNPAYATYRVLDYIDQNVRAKVYHSVGTFKDIQNVADATIIKTIETIKAIERAKVVHSGVKLLQNYFSEEIKPAKTRWTGRGMEPVESQDVNEEMVMYPVTGKYKGFYVDPYVAKTLRNETIDANNAIIHFFKFFNSKFFRPLFITFNTVFQVFNLVRDFKRFYKNIPGMTLRKAVILYFKAMPAAKARAFGTNNKKNAAVIQEMEKAQILSVTFNDVILGQTVEDKQIDDILKNSGIDSFASKKKTNKLLKPFIAILDFIKSSGDFIESLPKVGGYYFLKDQMDQPEMRSFIRRKIGSPDFLDKGYVTPATNEILLFSNAIAQGFRSDIEVAVQPKTRSGFWWKTIKTTFIPKLLMWAAILGLFGEGVKQMMTAATEYDKTNYTIIPLMKDQLGQTVYLRIPDDETGRFLGGIFWKLLTIGQKNQTLFRDFSDVFSYMAGQAPTVTPTLTATGAAAQFIAGQNPYDSFRGRNVLTDSQYAAGGMDALKPFLMWEFNTVGGSIFTKTFTGSSPKETTTGQKILQAPIIGNVIGGFIRVTSYGEQEAYRNVTNKIESQRAKDRIEENEKINAAVSAYQESKATNGDKLFVAENLYNDLIQDVIGHDPETAEEKTKARQIKTKFKAAIARGFNDPKISAMIEAQTNDEKAVILQSIKDTMADEDFKEFGNTLLEYDVISQTFVDKFKATDPQKLRDGLVDEGEVSESGLIHKISLYAKAIGTDPGTAFNRIFTGEVIINIYNDAIITERMPLDESQEIRANAGAGDDVKLDHIIPKKLGGSDHEDNLQIVPTDVWASYTPVENHLIQLLKDEKIGRKEAWQLIKDFKAGKITADEILKRQ